MHWLRVNWGTLKMSCFDKKLDRVFKSVAPAVGKCVGICHSSSVGVNSIPTSI